MSGLRLARASAIVLVIALASSGCSVFSDAATRIVRVDFRLEGRSASLRGFFPSLVTARPGDRVQFQPEWNGEPHTVSLGSLVPDTGESLPGLLRPFPEGWGEDTAVRQSAAHECYVSDGRPPDDPDTLCDQPEHNPFRRFVLRRKGQPAFTGRETYYSSGLLLGTKRWGMKVAPDAEPGTYTFVCAVHGPSMSGTLEVVPPGSRMAPQDVLDRTGAEEARAMADGLDGVVNANAREGTDVLAGAVDDAAELLAFVPRQLEVRVGRAVTWRPAGVHTVSFAPPPEALPLIFRPRTTPLGGDGEIAVSEVGAPPAGARRTDGTIDGGTYAGGEFRASGLLRDETFTLTFSEPGRYAYACLVHPAMTGVVLVS